MKLKKSLHLLLIIFLPLIAISCTRNDVWNKANSMIQYRFTYFGIKVFGTAANDRGNDIAVDSLGNVYVVGMTGGNLHGETNNGTTDAFISKYDSSGNHIWTDLIWTANNESALKVALDSAGNAYLIGYYFNAVDYDIFFARYNPSGGRDWITQIPLAGNQMGGSLAIYGNYIYITTTVNNDIYVNQYYTADGLQGPGPFPITILNASTESAIDIAVDNGGFVYLLGMTDGGPGIQSLSVTKINPAIGLPSIFSISRGALGIIFTPSGLKIHNNELYVAGTIDGPLDGETNAGGGDIILVKYDIDGNWIWTRIKGTTFPDYGLDITTDSMGTVYVTGATLGSLDGRPHTNPGSDDDIFITQYNANGNWINTVLYGTETAPVNDRSLGITCDGWFNLYITGYTLGDLANDGTYTGAEDLFIIRSSMFGPN